MSSSIRRLRQNPIRNPAITNNAATASASATAAPTIPPIKFEALYTQSLYKFKKNKTYHDGYILFYPTNSKANLHDDRNQRIDGIFTNIKELYDGNEMDFDRHIVQIGARVETESSSNNNSSNNSNSINSNSSNNHSSKEKENYSAATRTTAKSLQSSVVYTLTSRTASTSQPPPQQKKFRPLVPTAVPKQLEDEHQQSPPSSSSVSPNSYNAPTFHIPPHRNNNNNNNNIPATPSRSTTTIHPTLKSSPILHRDEAELLALFAAPEPSAQPVTNPSEPIKKRKAMWAEWGDENGDQNHDLNDDLDKVPVENEKPKTYKRPRIQQAPPEPIQQPQQQQQPPPQPMQLPEPTQQPSPFKKRAVKQPPPPQPSRSAPRSLHPILNSRLRFPSVEECERVFMKMKIQRSTNIPSHFPSASAYRENFTRAINEHLQVQLTQIAIQYTTLKLKRDAVTVPQGDTEYYYRNNGVSYYAGCSLREFEVDDTMLRFQPNAADRKGNVVLQVQKKEPSGYYSRDDIWIVSTSPTFESSKTFMTKSFFYGPSSNGNVELTPLLEADLNMAKSLLEMSPILPNVYAIRTVNANTEFMMIDNLKEHVTESPILSNILSNKPPTRKGGVQPQPKPPIISPENLSVYYEILSSVLKEYRLNEDQSRVLTQFAKSIAESTTKQPITLVHGVFGAGKSFMITVIIIFFYRVQQSCIVATEHAEQFRVVISSMTNVAVDRILLGLLKFGFEEFVRVGSLRKIAKPLLPFTAQMKNNNEEIKELQEMLKEEDKLSTSEIASIKETISKFKDQENKTLLSTAFVIGVTCVAATFDMLQDYESTILILDECSQMTEPMSMIPICRFKSSRILLVGDPLQLSPTITTSNGASKEVLEGLDKTLFERLTELGNEPVILRTQYRCHPVISSLANKLFYSSNLCDGITHLDRPAVLTGLQPLVFVDVNNGIESYASRSGGSFVNVAECDVVAKIVMGLVGKGVDEGEIGVVALYRGQVEGIESALMSARMYGNGNVNANAMTTKKKNTTPKSKVQVSTVDAFQGAEKSIIILTTVRTKSLGFIDEERRINVAITRAKHHLILVGNGALLQRSKVWGRILKEDVVGRRGRLWRSREFLAGLEGMEVTGVLGGSEGESEGEGEEEEMGQELEEVEEEEERVEEEVEEEHDTTENIDDDPPSDDMHPPTAAASKQASPIMPTDSRRREPSLSPSLSNIEEIGDSIHDDKIIITETEEEESKEDGNNIVMKRRSVDVDDVFGDVFADLEALEGDEGDGIFGGLGDDNMTTGLDWMDD